MWNSALFLFGRRKMVEHLLHTLVKILDVLVGLVRKGVTRGSSPDDFLCVRVEEIDNQRTHLVVVNRCGCVSEATTPAPAAAEAVVERVETLLILSHLYRYDRDLTARLHRRQALCRQGCIDSLFDAVDPQRVLCLDLFPGVRFVLAKISAAIIVGLHLLCE